MKRVGLYALCGLILMLSACHSTGNNFTSSGVVYLKPGVSTLDDTIVFLQAAPVNRYYRPDGSYMARWAHVSSAIPDGIYMGRELWIEFDAHHVLKRISKQHNVNTSTLH